MGPGRVDVAVVGGGPAGARAATLLAEAGLQVVLLERGGPRWRKPCAGGMPEAVFARLGLSDEVAEAWPRGYRVTTLRDGGPGESLEWSGLPYVVVRRWRFDEALRRLAAQRGCEVRHRHRVVGWDREGLHLLGPGGSRGRLWARCYLWANGAGGAGARPSGLGFRPARARRGPGRNFAVAFAAEVEVAGSEPGPDRPPGAAEEAEPLEFFLDPERNPFGYFWRFPLRQGYNLGVGTVWPTAGGGLREAFRWWLEQAVGASQYRLLWVGAGILPLRPSGRLVRGRHLALGDAGGLVNPLNGEGIRYAVASGEVAAEVVVRALRAGRLALLADYPGALWRRWDFLRLEVASLGLRGLLGCARHGRRSLYPEFVRLAHMVGPLRRLLWWLTAN